MGIFIKVKAKSQAGDYSVLINVDHIGSVLESAAGCQIICKNGDMVPIKNSFKNVEAGINKALGDTEKTIQIKGGTDLDTGEDLFKG